jgi:hypothetical protein
MEVEKPVNKLLSSDGKTSGWMGGIPLCKLGTNSRPAKTAHNTTQVIPKLATGIKSKKIKLDFLLQTVTRNPQVRSALYFYYFLNKKRS